MVDINQISEQLTADIYGDINTVAYLISLDHFRIEEKEAKINEIKEKFKSKIKNINQDYFYNELDDIEIEIKITFSTDKSFIYQYWFIMKDDIYNVVELRNYFEKMYELISLKKKLDKINDKY